MDITELHIGQRVLAPRGRLAEVVRLGRCGWPQCHHGAECVEVRIAGKAVTMNFAAAQIQAVEP